MLDPERVLDAAPTTRYAARDADHVERRGVDVAGDRQWRFGGRAGARVSRALPAGAGPEELEQNPRPLGSKRAGSRGDDAPGQVRLESPVVAELTLDFDAESKR